VNRTVTTYTRVSRSTLQRLTDPVDAASLGVFRIVFGVFVAVDAWRYLGYGWVRQYYIDPAFNFRYLFFDFVHPWPGDGMLLHFAATSVLALLAAAGLFYRVSSALLFVAYAYTFLLEQSVYMNHHYLMVLLAFLLACLPAHRAFSLDRARGAVTESSVPLWSIAILRFQLAIVYLFGAIAKLNSDWLRGEPMYSTLIAQPADFPAVAALVPPQVLALGIAYAGIAVDLAIPLLLCRRRTVVWGIALAASFHLLNGLFLRIGVFSWLMTGAVLIFLPPDWPRRMMRRQRAVDTRESPPQPAARRSFALVLVGLYATVQLALPLRHWLYPGDVNWTEEGHRFAWRMKLRAKHSVMTITATDPRTGRTWQIDPAQDLTRRQIAKMHTFPDMLLQYVHWHRDRLEADGIAAPEIRVDWLCSQNWQPLRRMADPTANLAAEPRTLWPARWILR